MVSSLSIDKDPKEQRVEQPRVVVDFDLLRRIGGRNFRDLGGHPASDGRRVRTEMIYRSAHLAHVPEDQPHPLSEIRLRTLVTLQSRLEVRHLGPPRAEFLQSGVRWEHIPIGDTWFREDGFNKIPTKPGYEHLVIVTEFRNGVGAAMLLEMLGVTRERIAKDFLESNAAFPNLPLTPRQLEPIFELIDESGGIEPFMHDVIGLEPSDLEVIRADLLE